MHDAGLWAVVPVKPLAQAKQRLAPLLDASERAALAQVMLRDVLDALAGHPHLGGMLVVSGDPTAQAMARAAGATVLDDSPACGLVPALRRAARALSDAGRDGMLIVPADLPGLARDDLALLAQAHGRRRGARGATLVAASHDGGTNALACSPPDALPLCYGPDSFRRHVRTARAIGLDPLLLSLPRLARDVDRPADLRAFMALSGAAQTHTYAWLQSSGVAWRLHRAARLPGPSRASATP
ncbi:2-phospho-L-lactate guanylyltransferase [Delftia acidovorans]|uniref:3-phospho-D-glycerate guanylyltransferase n=1 Tax=Delftia acidovorans TaxID=80866 RepID=A0A7T2W2D7_DELAC|nr:2-phospho-L-lactate guanylyltransferase [Delftia acidovorans]QPS11337.1 2-phospho-L-lactate guanylyltransferase [Delftia acidovorans]